MSRALPLVLWGLLSTGFWALLARDLVTIAVCLAATVPFTVFVFRDALDWNSRNQQ